MLYSFHLECINTRVEPAVANLIYLFEKEQVRLYAITVDHRMDPKDRVRVRHHPPTVNGYTHPPRT